MQIYVLVVVAAANSATFWFLMLASHQEFP